MRHGQLWMLKLVARTLAEETAGDPVVSSTPRVLVERSMEYLANLVTSFRPSYPNNVPQNSSVPPQEEGWSGGVYTTSSWDP